MSYKHHPPHNIDILEFLKNTDALFQPVTYTIAGLGFLGLSLSDWLLVLGLFTAVFNAIFIILRVMNLFEDNLIPRAVRIAKKIRNYWNDDKP